MVYSGNEPPEPLPGEKEMTKDPLRIELVNPTEKLETKWRLNLGKVYVIEHNYKVQDVGVIDERSLPKLLVYRQEVVNEGGKSWLEVI